MKSSKTHPDDVLEQLLMATTRPLRVKNLKAIHELCKSQAKGNKDLSRVTIGRLSQAMGLFKGRILNNAGSAAYRVLIDAWSTYVGPPTKSEVDEFRDVVFDRLKVIPDPALRSLVQAALIERNRLRAEVRLLKASTVVHIDRRSEATSLPSPKGLEDATDALNLTPTEYGALRHILSPSFLSDEGWTEGPHGELINERGRVVFPVGFSKAIRKVLDSEKGP